MEIAEITLKKAYKISWFFLTDVHVGNSNFDEQAFKKAVRYIKEVSKEREVIVQLGGDNIEAININDKRFNPTSIDETYSIKDLKDLPRKETKHFYELIKPIEHLVKFAHVGNHEESAVKYNYFDVYDYLVNDLLPDCKKLGYLSMIRLRLAYRDDAQSSKAFSIVSSHGRGGGGWKPGYSQSHVVDTFLAYDADFYLMGHIHKLNVYSQEIARLRREKLDIEYKREWYGTGGTFLRSLKPGSKNYHEGSKGYLSDIGFIEIQIDRSHGAYSTKMVDHLL